jgi:hypothetical protein
MRKSLLHLPIAVALLYGSTLRAQHSATTILVKSLTAAPNTDNITGTQTMVVNRSHVLKDKVDGAGTLYVSLEKSDVAGLTNTEVAQRLASTSVLPQKNVRTVDVDIDIDHPLFVTTTGEQPFMIGTTILDGKVNSALQVNSFITLGELKITKK